MSSGRVLVVDDDVNIRESLAQILSEEGFDVAQACNGLEALAEIDRYTPDVVLLDLMMPVLDGWKTLQILRKMPKHFDLPVVVLSAVPSAGCSDFIQKPISLDRLLSLLDAVRTKSCRRIPAARPS